MREEDRPTTFNIEFGLYLLLILLGAALRLWSLGARPLSEEEAQLAYGAWHVYRGVGVDLGGLSPLPSYACMLLYFLLGPSDSAVRLLPALVGSAMISLPYFLRPYLGRVGALTSSALIALSPSFIFFSRNLSGDILVAFGALLIFIGALHYSNTKSLCHLGLIAFGAAVALTSGTESYTLIASLLLLIPISLRLSRVRANGWLSREYLDKALLVFALLLLLLSTGGLLLPQGLQATADLFSTWLSQWPPQPTGNPWYFHLFLLLSYEPPALILGLAAIATVYILGQRGTLQAALVAWFGLAFVIHAIMGFKAPGGILHLLIPLILLVGMAVERVFASSPGRVTPEVLYVATSTPILAYLYLQAAHPYISGDVLLLLFVFLALLFEASVIFLFAVWFGGGVAVRGVAILALVVWGLLSLHTAWGLNYGHGPAEPLLGRATSPDVRNLVRTLEELSNRKEGERHSIGIALREANYSLLWYLRDFKNLARELPAPVTITSAQEPLGQPDCIGERFRLWTSWEPESPMALPPLRWYLFGEPSSLGSHDIIMWLAQEGGSSLGEK